MENATLPPVIGKTSNADADNPNATTALNGWTEPWAAKTQQLLWDYINSYTALRSHLGSADDIREALTRLDLT